MERARQSKPGSLIFLACAVFALRGRSAPIDESKLPPAANETVDFDRNIRPIFEANCFRCHGPERPKSSFRLDNRESALKGGENGVDILPGKSARSPLIHYVTRLVPDLEMPPPGKGKPLTPAQIGLLRAWIDQGAVWGTTNEELHLAFSVSPALGSVSVRGDKAKFREVEGRRDGSAAGLEQFSIDEQLNAETRLSLSGKFILPQEDFRLKLELHKDEFGFVRGGFEQWRKYYDDSGGYYRPYLPPEFRLGRDLHLDVGRAWLDFGLTLPHWPQIVLGYEYQFKEGSKSMLEWGNVNGKNIYPASEEIHERVHIAKLDMTYDVFGFTFEEKARVEFYDLKTRQDMPGFFTTGLAPDVFTHTRETGSHIQGINTLHFERQITEGWLISGGYLYSKLDGDASLDQFTSDPLGVPVSGKFWSGDTTVLKRESQIVSLANLLTPVEWLTVSAAAQSEWTRQEGFGDIHLDEGDPDLPGGFSFYPATVQSDLDKQKTSENVSARFSGIPATVLFAEARLDQETIGQFERDEPQPGTSPDMLTTFLRNTDFSNHRDQLRGGFNTSPWGWCSLNAHYQKRISDSEYDNTKISLDPTGYPAFIRARKIDTDEVQARLVVRPLSWLRTTFTCQVLSTDFHTTTDPVPGAINPSRLLAGNYDAHNFGVSATITAIPNLYLSGSFTYGDTRLLTLQAADPIVVPYRGNVYSFYGGATYGLNPATDLQLTYSFSRADYGQDNVVGGLPLGLNFTRHGLTVGLSRRFSKLLSGRIGYGFFEYSEPSSGGFNDYIAHGVFATLVMKWP